MANRFGTAVMFTLEKNVMFLSAQVNFGATGIPSLIPNNSKGFCSIAPDAVMFSANSVGSSATLSSVTSFAGLYPGMTLTGTFGTGTISSITAAAGGSITLVSGTGVVTTNGGLVAATGGRYRVQFGTQAGVRLDTYTKLLGLDISQDMSSGSASGSASVQALAPAAPDYFIVQNNITTKTIPSTLTSNSTDASIVVQLGNHQAGAGGNFVAKDAVAGTQMRLRVMLGQSTAP
jgi:hypothetical protein